jgi:hypothetical protein
MLGDFALGHRQHVAGMVKQQGARTGGTLIESEYGCHDCLDEDGLTQLV